MAGNPFRVGDAVYVPDGMGFLRRRVVATTRRRVLVAPYCDSGYAIPYSWRKVRRALPPLRLSAEQWAEFEAEFTDAPSGARR